MKYITLLVLTVFIASPVHARNVERTAAPTSDQSSTGTFDDVVSSNLNKNSAQRASDYTEDSVRSGQAATERNYHNMNVRRRCQNMNGEWLRPMDVGYDACMIDSRTLKK